MKRKSMDRGQSSGSSLNLLRPTCGHQHEINGTKLSCGSDDSRGKASKPQTTQASRASTSEGSARDIQPSCKQQQIESPFQSSMRAFQEQIEDIETQGAKRIKASPNLPRLMVLPPQSGQDSSRSVAYHSPGTMVANLMELARLRSTHHALQDYQMHLMILEKMGKTAGLMMARQEQPTGTHQVDGTINEIISAGSNSIMQVRPEVEVSIAPGRAINTQRKDFTKSQEEAPVLLLDLLKGTNDNASQWLQQLPLWLQNLRSLKDSLTLDKEALQAQQQRLDKKHVEIDTLEAKYNDLARMTPQAQQEELQQVRKNAMSTMQQEVNGLEERLKECSGGMQAKRAQIEKLEGSIRGLESTIPVAIRALTKVLAQLHDM